MVAIAIALGLGAIGELVDLIFGTQGWWLALGTLGICGAGLYAAGIDARTRPS